jgi:triacylglycerol lipase
VRTNESVDRSVVEERLQVKTNLAKTSVDHELYKSSDPQTVSRIVDQTPMRLHQPSRVLLGSREDPATLVMGCAGEKREMRHLIGLAGVCTLIATAAAAVGPALETDVTTLDRAVRCPVRFSGSLDPLLLVHGTATTPADEWALTYGKLLPELGFDVCTVRLPELALTDIQTSTEYVVHAIRTMAAQSGRQVDVIGYSQGGLEPRWAVKWWPDVLAAVDDLVTFGAPHHGNEKANDECVDGSCDASIWQQRQGSNFISKLNSDDETPGPADYTSIYSQSDGQVTPVETAVLEGASNIPVQVVCNRQVVHQMLPIDAAVFAIALDALAHDGPAVPSRIAPSVCQESFLPGMSQNGANIAQAAIIGDGSATLLAHPDVNSEPPLRPYALPEPSRTTGVAGAIGVIALIGHRRHRRQSYAKTRQGGI